MRLVGGRKWRCDAIILSISIKEGQPMNFLNFLTQSTSVLNFNLSNLTSGLGFGNSALEISAPKMITPEQMVKEPQTPEEQKGKEIAEGGDKRRVEQFTRQQQLINQYMHLNIQLLSQKLQNLEQIDKLPKQEKAVVGSEVKSNKKKIKKVNGCGHDDREHYAKGMCNNCYHKYGRTKKPWNCPHDKLYANGMCQNCYINTYNRKRREERNEGKIEEADLPGLLKVEEQEQ